MFYDDDADLSVIQGRKVAVLGYGSQGHAHALSLRDSGVDVRVGLPEGCKSRAKAEAEGLRVVTPAEACAEADVIMILAPDPVQRKLYAEARRAATSTDGDALFFGHGLNIRFGLIKPPAGVDVAHGRAEGPGPPRPPPVRRRQGRALPHRRRAGRDRQAPGTWRCPTPRASAAPAPASSRPPSPRRPRPTCSASRPCSAAALTELIQAGFETLIEAGYQPEVAYFECLHELKLIVDLMYEGGISKMRWSISDTAEYGDYTRGPRIVTEETKAEMKQILAEIQDGTFAKRVDRRVRQRAARTTSAATRTSDRAPDRGQTGAKLRPMMSWIERRATGQPPRDAREGVHKRERRLTATAYHPREDCS